MNLVEAVNEMLKGEVGKLVHSSKTNPISKENLAYGTGGFIPSPRDWVTGYVLTSLSKETNLRLNNLTFNNLTLKDVQEHHQFTVPNDSIVKKKVRVQGTSQFYAVESGGKLFSYKDEQEVTKL